MATYGDRVFQALGQFHSALAIFEADLARRSPDPPRVPKKALHELVELAARTRAGHDALGVSIGHIANQRGVDLVDMQVRLKGEAAQLADALRRIGDAVERQHFVREAFSTQLVGLHEAASRIAAALFPSAVQGLREANVKLWEFQKLQRPRYGEIMAGVVREQTLPVAAQRTVEDVARRVNAAFDEVDALLNELAESRPSDARMLRARLRRMTSGLRAAIAEAEGRLDDEAIRMFRPVVSASRRIAADVERLLRRIVVPIFPPHEALGPLAAAIDAGRYGALGGVQVFALLNIAARMHATVAAGKPLLHPDHRLTVTEVFPDRVYFKVGASLIAAAQQQGDIFKAAPASLHKFNDGSLKQHVFRKGNLQLSYEWLADGEVMVDADIDKFRRPIPHLLGEVLVNHLTGGKTDQFDVFDILGEQRTPAIGGFTVLTGESALA